MDGDPLIELEHAVRSLAHASVWAQSPQVLIDCLDQAYALASRLDAVRLGLIREIDGRDLARRQGATTTTAWLRDRYRLSGGTAARQVRLAAALHGGLPKTVEAMAAGTVNLEQAQVIAAAVPTLPAGVRTQGEAFLVGQCAVFGPRELGRLTSRLLDVVAPEVAEKQAAQQLAKDEDRAHADRCLYLTDVPGQARVRLTGWLDQESAAVVRAAIDPLCAPRPVDEAGLRSPQQRRADALVEVCRLALAGGELPDNGGDRPQVTVTVDLDTLRGQIGAATLDDGTVLSPAAARRLACDARIVPAVLGSTGQVLDLGRERRLFTGPTRRALVLRDRGCAFPGCDRPPRWCDGHHLVSWLDDGPTSLDNGVLLCAHHHRVIHQGDWQVKIASDGLPDFIPPRYLDPDQQPRRNIYHRNIYHRRQ
ncbi:HNH endonuclease signature motif containing protein [Rugosimonospora acidiphila]|uniref:HNH endonuclease signature motif containing protein n=1 Tax=Rugosimonospora acidiphila TaxID=556531 RepID=A0ABP9S3Q7_9ACTN